MMHISCVCLYIYILYIRFCLQPIHHFTYTIFMSPFKITNNKPTVVFSQVPSTKPTGWLQHARKWSGRFSSDMATVKIHGAKHKKVQWVNSVWISDLFVSLDFLLVPIFGQLCYKLYMFFLAGIFPMDPFIWIWISMGIWLPPPRKDARRWFQRILAWIGKATEVVEL